MGFKIGGNSIKKLSWHHESVKMTVTVKNDDNDDGIIVPQWAEGAYK